jgi:hypothetical protein
MANKHESILASYASVKPEATGSIEAVIEKEKEPMDPFREISGNKKEFVLVPRAENSQ